VRWRVVAWAFRFVSSNSVGCFQIEKWGVVVLAAAASFHAIFRGIGGR
jgi:hypothetical protein